MRKGFIIVYNATAHSAQGDLEESIESCLVIDDQTVTNLCDPLRDPVGEQSTESNSHEKESVKSMNSRKAQEGNPATIWLINDRFSNCFIANPLILYERERERTREFISSDSSIFKLLLNTTRQDEERSRGIGEGVEGGDVL